MAEMGRWPNLGFPRRVGAAFARDGSRSLDAIWRGRAAYVDRALRLPMCFQGATAPHNRGSQHPRLGCLGGPSICCSRPSRTNRASILPHSVGGSFFLLRGGGVWPRPCRCGPLGADRAPPPLPWALPDEKDPHYRPLGAAEVPPDVPGLLCADPERWKHSSKAESGRGQPTPENGLNVIKVTHGQRASCAACLFSLAASGNSGLEKRLRADRGAGTSAGSGAKGVPCIPCRARQRLQTRGSRPVCRPRLFFLFFAGRRP